MMIFMGKISTFLISILIVLCEPTGPAAAAHAFGRSAGQSQHFTGDTVLEGVASYYGEAFRGKRTHSDEIFNPDSLTAACNVLPMGIWVRVTNLRNGSSVVVRLNDRMARGNKRLIDVSEEAARRLGFHARGLTRVKVEVLRHD